jgi:hypothetical protein
MIGEEEGADADSAPWIAVLVWCGKKVNFLPFRFWNNQSGSGPGFGSGSKMKYITDGIKLCTGIFDSITCHFFLYIKLKGHRFFLNLKAYNFYILE